MPKCTPQLFRELLGGHFEHLRVLDLGIENPHFLSGFHNTIKKLPRLEDLTIALGSEANLDVQLEVRDMLNLPNLKLFRTVVVQTDITFLHNATQSKSITKLFLKTNIEYDRLSDPNKRLNFSLIPSLQNLQWICQGNIPVLPFLASAINIQELGLSNAQLADDILVHMKQCSLYALGLHQITNLDDSLLARIGHLPSLESLGLAECDLITDEGISLLLGSQTLQMVNIANCINISEKGAALIRQCENIREFEFTPFQEKNWTFTRAQNILRTIPVHLQAIDYLANLLNPRLFPWRDLEQANLAQLRLMQMAENEPLEYIHWKRLGFVHLTMKEFKQSLEAYQHAKQLGMDFSYFEKVLNIIKELQAAAQNQRQANQ